MGVFKKIWPDVWSARMEYILNNAMCLLVSRPTLLGINRMADRVSEESCGQCYRPIVKIIGLKNMQVQSTVRVGGN